MAKTAKEIKLEKLRLQQEELQKQLLMLEEEQKQEIIAIIGTPMYTLLKTRDRAYQLVKAIEEGKSFEFLLEEDMLPKSISQSIREAEHEI